MGFLDMLRIGLQIIIILFFFNCSSTSNSSKEYYDTGELKSTGYLRGGVKDGRWVSFTKERDTSEVVFFTSGAIKWKNTYVNNQLFLHQEFKLGVLNGKFIRYHPNRSVETLSNYMDGVPHGKTIGYFEDGTLQVESTYEMGNLTDEFTQYYRNGNVFLHTLSYSPDGVFTIYDTLGNRKYDIKFERNVPKDTLKVY